MRRALLVVTVAGALALGYVAGAEQATMAGVDRQVYSEDWQALGCFEDEVLVMHSSTCVPLDDIEDAAAAAGYNAALEDMYKGEEINGWMRS